MMELGGNKLFKTLGLDWGEKFVGVAIAHEGEALPLAVWPMTDKILPQLIELCLSENIQAIVVGKPLASDGSRDKVSGRWLDISKALQNWCLERGINYVFFDERHSSAYANRIKNFSEGKHRGEISQPQTKKHNTDRIDALAAAKILQDYLDSLI